MIERDYSDRDDIIYVKARGLWAIADVDEHYERLRDAIEIRRAAGRPVRVLSDIREAQKQSPDVEARILWHINFTYKGGDRVALLTANDADKAYVRSCLGEANLAAFNSRLPAEQWLMDDHMEAPLAAAPSG